MNQYVKLLNGFKWLVVVALFCSCGKPTSPAADSPKQTGAPPTSESTASIAEPVELVTKSGIEMIYLPGGAFVMGSEKGNPDEAPAHRVKIGPFAIDRFEVTQEMFVKAQLPNPSHWQDNPKNPVERVRWNDAKQYCNERSLLEGLKPCYNEKSKNWDCDFAANGYRLPTEAEWEYAARSGSAGDFDFGAANKLKQFAWFDENAGERTHPVGQKKANQWGIFDLYGNVSEWCEDVYLPAYYKESPPADPRGPADQGKDTLRALRGGSWKSSAAMCRVSFRQGQRTGDTDACFYTDFCGFRCVRKIDPADLNGLRKPLK